MKVKKIGEKNKLGPAAQKNITVSKQHSLTSANDMNPKANFRPANHSSMNISEKKAVQRQHSEPLMKKDGSNTVSESNKTPPSGHIERKPSQDYANKSS